MSRPDGRRRGQRDARAVVGVLIGGHEPGVVFRVVGQWVVERRVVIWRIVGELVGRELVGGSSSSGGTVPSSGTRVVAYLPNYSGSYATWAQTINFSKMTHFNLAFATATTGNGWDMGASDSDVATLVKAAHAAGVKVIASLGGGGGDQTVIAQFQNAGNVPTLVGNLDSFVSSHDFDGVDVDIEDPNNLGSDYTTFVYAVVAKLRPKGKLVTAAVAQYLQDSMQDATLHEFDFVNVMIYSTYSDSVSAMTYYTNTKGVPADLVTLGAGFFGTDSSGNEYAYSQIIAADPNAWSYDQTQVNGQTVSYTGMASMKKLADYSKGFGGDHVLGAFHGHDRFSLTLQGDPGGDATCPRPGPPHFRAAGSDSDRVESVTQAARPARDCEPRRVG